MEEKSKIKIIEFDRPNKNGRIYTRSEINVLPDLIPVMTEAPKPEDFYPKLISALSESKFKDENVAGSAKPSMEDDGIYVDLNIFESKKSGEKLLNLLMDGHKLMSTGMGGIEENGRVIDYRIVFLFPVSPENNAWAI